MLKQIITILCIQNSQSLSSYQNLTTSEKTPTTEAFFISIPFLDKSATTKTTVYQKKQIIQELPIICTAERKEDDI